jgi:hypothetical protein
LKRKREGRRWSKAEGSRAGYLITLLLGFLPSLQLLQHKTFKLGTIENRIEASSSPNKRSQKQTILGEEPNPTLLPNKNLLNNKSKKESGI